jgi:hypothetical protein
MDSHQDDPAPAGREGPQILRNATHTHSRLRGGEDSNKDSFRTEAIARSRKMAALIHSQNMAGLPESR